MKLHDFLNTAGGATPAPSKPVSFRVVGKNQEGNLVTAEAKAVLVFVSEFERQEALKQAQAEAQKQYPDSKIPPERLSDEETYQILYLALRDCMDSRVNFARDIVSLKAALTQATARELYIAYSAFLDAEFPPYIDDTEFALLVEEAKSKSLAVLLSSGDYYKIQRALPGLAVRFAK